MVIAAAPGLAAAPKPELPEPESPWTKPTKVEAPATPAGSVKAPDSEAEAKPSAEVAAWRAAQKTRAASGKAKSSASRAATAAEATPFVPGGQGEVPWHRIIDTRLNDALVARVNVSNGNLMLAATDFAIAGVGQKLQMARTYNSLEAPWGKVSQRWWQSYEPYLQFGDGEVVVYDATGEALRFKETSTGGYTTPERHRHRRQGHRLRVRRLTPPDQGDHPRGHRHAVHLRRPQPRQVPAACHRGDGQRPHRSGLALRLHGRHPLRHGNHHGHRPRRRRHEVPAQRGR
ncbi:DUF6531 domain-containing protein [Streptomyces qaidamensis]